MEKEKTVRNNPSDISKAMSKSELNNVDLEGKRSNSQNPIAMEMQMETGKQMN